MRVRAGVVRLLGAAAVVAVALVCSSTSSGASGATGSISGTVTESGTGTPLAGACVAASLAFGGGGHPSACTNGSGRYTIGGLAPGRYSLRFTDQLSGHVAASISSITVDPGVDLFGVDVQMDLGATISGTVTDATTHDPLAGVCARASSAGGDGEGFVSSDGCSDASGHYQTDGLPAGSYRVTFHDSSGPHLNQQTSADLTVAVGATTTGVDAAMVVGGSLSGTIVDGTTGTPVAGVCVTPSPRGSFSGFFSRGDHCTDTAGHYRSEGLPTGTYTLRIADPSHRYPAQYLDGAVDQARAGILVVRAGADTPDTNAGLIAGGAISGTVVAADTGAPLPGACVSATGDHDNGSACADADGRYTISGLQAGAHKVSFVDVAHAVYLNQYYNGQDGFASADPVTVVAGSTATAIDARMTRGSQLTGTVTDAANVPLAGVCPQAKDATGIYTLASSCTDAAGHYAVTRLRPGTYTLRFPAPPKENVVGQWYDGVSDESSAKALSVGAASTLTGLDAHLQAGGILAGTITDGAGPVAGVCAAAYPDQGVFAGSTSCSDATGRYSVVGLATGGYKLRFTPPSGANLLSEWFDKKADQASATSVTATQGVTTSGLDVRLQAGGSVTGTISDSLGNPVTGACVQAMSGTGGGRASCSGSTGSYTVQGLATGSYKLQLFPPSGSNFLPQWYDAKADQAAADPVLVSQGAEKSAVDFTLRPAGTVRGKITDAATGAPVAGACVTVHPASSTDVSLARSCSDPDGNYTVVGLATGNDLVQFTDSSGKYVDQWYKGAVDGRTATIVPVVAGNDISGIDAALLPAGHVAGTITDATGAPVAGVCPRAYPSTGQFVSTFRCSDASGSYTIDGLPSGSYRVEFAGTYYDYPSKFLPLWFNAKPDRASADPVSVSQGTTANGIDARLQLGASISGALTGPDGAPAAFACARAFTGFVAWADTCADSAGHYKLEGLPSGSYTVEFHGNNLATQWYNAKPSQGAADPIAVGTGPVTGIDARLQSDAGTIKGTITDATSGLPLAHACMDVRYDLRACADVNGNYKLTVPAGTWRAHFDDAQDGFVQQWWRGRASSLLSDTIAVSVGAVVDGIDAALVPGGSISGRVTDVSNGRPLNRTCIQPYTAAGPVENRFVCTGSDGAFSIKGLPAGSYALDFKTTFGLYIEQWFNGKPDQASADPVTVSTGADSAASVAMVLGGSVSGTVTDAASGAGIANVCVRLSRADTGAFAGIGGCTGADGRYQSNGLATGQYKVAFVDSSGSTIRWWNDKPDIGSADPVTVSVGTITTNVDLVLGSAPPTTSTTTTSTTTTSTSAPPTTTPTTSTTSTSTTTTTTSTTTTSTTTTSTTTTSVSTTTTSTTVPPSSTTTTTVTPTTAPAPPPTTISPPVGTVPPTVATIGPVDPVPQDPSSTASPGDDTSVPAAGTAVPIRGAPFAELVPQQDASPGEPPLAARTSNGGRPSGAVRPLELEQPSAPPGGEAVARGSGCAAGSTVSFSLSGTPVGTTRADATGRFEGRLALQPLPIGRYNLDGECAGLRFESPIDVVVSASTGGSSTSSAATAAAGLVFFVLLLGVLTQGRGTPPPRRRSPSQIARDPR